MYPLSPYRKFIRLLFDESIRPTNQTNHGISVPRITLSLRTFVCKLLLISLPLPTHSHSVGRVMFSQIIVPRPIKIHHDNREIKNRRDNMSEMRERDDVARRHDRLDHNEVLPETGRYLELVDRSPQCRSFG